MNESDSVNSNKGSHLKAGEISEFNTQNNRDNASRNEMEIDSELLRVQQSTKDSQLLDKEGMPADDQITAKENEKDELQKGDENHQNGSTEATIQQILPHESKSTSTLQQEYIQKIIDMENKRKELQKIRRRRCYERTKILKRKKNLQESQEILEKKRLKSEYAKERYRRLRKTKVNEQLTPEEIAHKILDRERKRKELANLRQQRYREKFLADQLNAQPSKSISQGNKLEIILERCDKKRKKDNHSQEETVQESIEREERKRERHRERQRRYRERQQERINTSQVQMPQSNIIDKEERKREKQRERQRRYRERQNLKIQKPQRNVVDQDKRRKELGKERQRRYRERCREKFSRPQNDSRQCIQAEQNAQVFQEATSQCTEVDSVYVKQEFEDENALIIPDISTSMNSECDPCAVEMTQETSILPETVEDDEIIDIKEENIEVSTPTTRQDFVFVACADTVALNEATIRNIRQPCPYCGKTIQQLNKHVVICDGKFVYFCIFCQTKITRRCNIKRHIKKKHSSEIANAPQHLNSVDKVFQEIVAKRKELNISTPEEKEQAILELQNAIEVATVQAHKEICIVTKNQQELIIPDSIETHQESTADVQKSNTPFVVINQTLEIPTVVQIQNIVQDHSVTTDMTKEKDVTSVANKNAETSEESNAPFTIIHEKINPVFVSVPNQAVVFQKKNADSQKSNYFHCNECVYKSPRKTCLQKHITNCHSDKLNLKWHECNRCRKNFQSKEHWKAHKDTCNVTAYYYCPFCPKCTLFDRMVEHVQLQHSKEIKNKKTDEINDLLAAKKDAVESSTVNNQEAVTATAHVYDLRNNGTRRKGNVVCHIEGTRSANLSRQSQFSNVDIEICNYVYCDECIYKSTSKTLLLKHITNYHSDKLNLKWYKCNGCDKKFQYQAHLKAHKATCKEMQAYYYCPFCPKYMIFQNVMKHIRSQHPKEIENKKSDEIKNLLVATKEAVESLTVNVQSQHPKEIENKKSDKTNNLSVAAKKAKTVKAKVKPKITQSEYFCDHCQYKTSRKDNLARHIKRKKIHNDKIIQRFRYTCVFCSISYARLRYTKEHILQKHSSKLEEKSIDEVMKEVDATKTIVRGPQTSKQANFMHPEIDPYEIDASTLEYVPVYCFKCNHVKTSYGRAGRRLRHCQDCGTQMIYLCSKCKNMHTIQFPLLAIHWKQCTENTEITHFNLHKLAVYSCADCSYVGTHKPKFESHLVRSNHKMKKAEEDKSKKNDDEEMEMYNEAKFAVTPCVTDYATMTRRYCSKCDKIVTEDVQKRKCVTNESCQVCGTRFQLQCVKCNMNYNSYISIRYHLNSKCFPGDYKCIKCGKHSCNWQLMQKHYLNSHTHKKEAFLCEFCSFRSTHRTNFYLHLTSMHSEQSTNIVPDNIQLKKLDIDYFCDKCDFTSKRKGSIKVHLQNVHGTKRHKCKLCKFRTRYEASLRRHYSIRHKNYY